MEEVITDNATVADDVQPPASVPITVYVHVGAAEVAGGVAVDVANEEVGLEVTVAIVFAVLNKETAG